VFELQEELTRCIVLAIAPAIADSEVRKLRLRRADSSAYALGVQANAELRLAWRQVNVAGVDAGLGSARRALAIDPDSTAALVAVAACVLAGGGGRCGGAERGPGRRRTTD
jgi:hypothetical protein